MQALAKARLSILVPTNSSAPVSQRVIAFLKGEKVRYLIGGGANAAIGYGVFVAAYFLLTPYGVHYLVIFAVAQLIAITFAFFNYRHFVFRSQGEPWAEYLRFLSVYAVAALLNLVLIVVLVDWARLHVLLGQAIAMVGVVVLSYLSHRRFTFGRP